MRSKVEDFPDHMEAFGIEWYPYLGGKEVLTDPDVAEEEVEFYDDFTEYMMHEANNYLDVED
jgi:hypothetical protein